MLDESLVERLHVPPRMLDQCFADVPDRPGTRERIHKWDPVLPFVSWMKRRNIHKPDEPSISRMLAYFDEMACALPNENIQHCTSPVVWAGAGVWGREGAVWKMGGERRGVGGTTVGRQR
jgi:hypothetical protein